MSRSGQSLLLLLRRCVAVRPVALPTRGGLIQQRTWSSATRAGCAQRLCQFRSAVDSRRLGLCTKAGAPSDDEYPHLPAYQSDSEPEKKETYIVQVKGFPWSCTAQDLLHFFSECRIRDGLEGIHLTVDKQGRSSSQAFIELEHEEDVTKALEKHRQYLGSRYVEVYEVTNSEAESILKKAFQVPSDGVVRLRGLPFTCTEADIVQFFLGLDIAENGITIVTDHRGRNSGEAFVQFASQEVADEALQRDREVIGNRYIEVFSSRKEDVYSSWRDRGRMMNSPLPNRTVSSSQPRLHTGLQQRSGASSHFIHIRGLPFQASGEDIVKFFYPLVVSKILIEYRSNGRPSGEADVYFPCHQDAMAAMSKDRQYIGDRYIELYLNSTQDSYER